MAGRPRKPTALHAIQGSRVRQDRSREPRLPTGAPAPPKWLKGEALELWKRLAPMLTRAGVLALADATSLARLCQSFQWWREFDAQAAAARASGKKPNTVAALLGIARKEGEVVDRLCTQFGLTPAARSKVTGKPEAPADPVEAWRKANGLSA